MSRPDDPGIKPLDEYNKEDMDALAEQYLAEAEAIEDVNIPAGENNSEEEKTPAGENNSEEEKTPAEENNSEEEKTLAGENNSEEEKTPTEESNSAEEKTPGEENNSAEEKTLAEESGSTEENAPAGEDISADDSIPAGESVSTDGNTPAGESVSTERNTPAEENISTEENTPAGEGGSAEEGTPVEEDFLPFTVSVADSDGLAVILLEKGTKLPASVKKFFSAPYKTPSAVKFRLYMGEGLFAKDNILIGDFKLPGIKEYKGGITRIVMTLRMERNGDIEIDLLDEGSVSRRHEKIELHLAECCTALKDKNVTLTAEDAELRDSFLVIQRGRYIAATAERLFKANKKDIEREKAAQIKEKIKELKDVVNKTDPSAMTSAQKTSLKNLMNEISAMF